MSDNTTKVQVGDTVFCYKNGKNGVVLGAFKSISGESLVAIDYSINCNNMGAFVEKEKDVRLAFDYVIADLCAQGLSQEQARFFAPLYYQSLDKDADLIKIKQYLSLG